MASSLSRTVAVLLLGLALGACTSSGPGASAPSPAPPGARPLPLPGAQSSWTTYGHDGSRDAVAATTGRWDRLTQSWRSAHLDGDVYAQPLIAGKMVLAATESNSVYAFDWRTGRTLWRSRLGMPVDGDTLPCGNIDPSGITSTPVVDITAGLIYAVAFLAPGHHEVFAIRLHDGSVAWRRNVDVRGLDPTIQQQRAALALANGRVYVAFGGLFGDCGDYHGWVVGVPSNGRGPVSSYQVPSGRAAGIWAPSGPAIGPHGSLFVATGNSFSGSRFDYGSAVIRLDPGLRVLDYFAPREWAKLNTSDTDIGSVGPLLLSPRLGFQGGKAGVVYLFDPAGLGTIGGQTYDSQVCEGGGIFGGLAATSSAIFVPCTNGLVALKLAGDGSSFAERWRSAPFSAGPPIVAGKAVWALDTNEGALRGFDAATGQPLANLAVGAVAHFAAPSAAGRCVIVPTIRRLVSLCDR